jgi:hypothetical protein
MSNFFNRYRKRIGVTSKGQTEKDIITQDAIDIFNDLTDNFRNPTVHHISYIKPFEFDIKEKLETNVVIADCTRNDSDLFDEKLIHTKLDSKLDSGSCVEWADEVWLVANEEHNSVQSHRTYVMKRCQTELNLLLHGETWSFPCIINNLNIYSDGSKENVNITTSSAKYQVMIPQNIITDCIKLQSRIAIGNRIYEVSLIDKLTNKNIYTLVAVEVVANSLDDLDNNVAYNDEISKPEDIVYWNKIQGSDIIYLGETAEFLCEDAISWKLVLDSEIEYSYLIDKDSFYLVDANGFYLIEGIISNNASTDRYGEMVKNEIGICNIKCNTSNKLIGREMILQALDADGNVIDEKIINVRGYF